MKWFGNVVSIVVISVLVSGCITPSRLRQVTAEPVHLVHVTVTGPDELSSPDRRGLTDVELTIDGEEVTPFVSYRVPATEETYTIDLSALESRLRAAYERAMREELGARLATPEETARLPGVAAVTDQESFESFVAARPSGTYLYAQLEIEPDLSYPRVSGDLELEDGRQIDFKAHENVPRTVQIDLSSRIDLRTPEQPSRNLIRYNFNLNYARTGTPDYPTQVLRRPSVTISSRTSLLVAIAVRGGRYRVSAEQTVVTEDLVAAASRLGDRASQPLKDAK
ncbi:MAG TPA: hypothetical protein VJ932_03725 [Alkalispirochaeta sp.]|nr:hypothetical protein [Alkalispirochaeta sp.]